MRSARSTSMRLKSLFLVSVMYPSNLPPNSVKSMFMATFLTSG